MPLKKRNLELEFGGIHNIPEQFFYKYKDITLLSENLFQTPKLIKNRVLQADVVKKIDDWVYDNKIQVKKRMEWVELIHPLTDLFAIPKGKRKEPFSHYKETQIVKLK